MDYGHGYPAPVQAPPPVVVQAPPPPPRHYHIARCHHFSDAYFPYSRDYVIKRRKTGILAGISATSLLLGSLGISVGLGALGVTATIAAPALAIGGAAGLIAATVSSIKRRISAPPPPGVVYEDGVGMVR